MTARTLFCRMLPKVMGSPGFSRATILALASHLIGWLVLPQPDVNRVPQEVVSRPGQIGDLSDELRLNPMHARKNERGAKAGLRRRQDGQRRLNGSRRLRRSASTLSGIPVPTRPA
jgi:hypothetical protein